MPKPIQFDGVNVVIAENQEPYIPLPAQLFGDPMGTVLTCWEFTEEEAEEFLRTRKLWISHWTFNQAFQPLCPSTSKPVAIVEPASYLDQSAECNCGEIETLDSKGDTVNARASHTQFIEEPGDALDRASLRGAGFTSPGWYYWNITGSKCFGPFKDRPEAIVNLGKYASEL